MTDRELAVEEIFSHLDGIIETSERMTSGNFMHNKNANKLSANIIKDRLKYLLSEPQLPSNIDEVAEAYGAQQGAELSPFAQKFFKAGAEWILNQLKQE